MGIQTAGCLVQEALFKKGGDREQHDGVGEEKGEAEAGLDNHCKVQTVVIMGQVQGDDVLGLAPVRQVPAESK